MARKDCPACGGTGWKPVETGGVRRVTRCDCQESERTELLLKEARIPPRYEHCAVENFDIRKRSEEHTSELQSQSNLVCRLLLEKKKRKKNDRTTDRLCY